MKKQAILLISLFFTTLTFSMEERADGSKIEDLQNLQTNQVDTNQSLFDLLPDEIIEYIFSLLIEEAYAKGSNPLEKLIAILSNRDLANIKSINKRWNAIASDEGITKRITNLTNYLIQNNKRNIKAEFIEICEFEDFEKLNYEWQKTNNTEPLALVDLSLNKAIVITKQKYIQSLKTNLNKLPIELKEKILNHMQLLKTLTCFLINNKGNFNTRYSKIIFELLLIAGHFHSEETIELILRNLRKFNTDDVLLKNLLRIERIDHSINSIKTTKTAIDRNIATQAWAPKNNNRYNFQNKDFNIINRQTTFVAIAAFMIGVIFKLFIDPALRWDKN